MTLSTKVQFTLLDTDTMLQRAKCMNFETERTFNEGLFPQSRGFFL
jgi:hypothetical protein